MKRPPVAVLGLDCPTGLQTARTFAERGIDVIGIASDLRHPCARTRVCRRKILADPDADGPARSLLSPESPVPDGSVVVPCTDAAVLSLARHRTELSGRYRIAIPSRDVIDLQLDKARFAEFAAAHGLPIPRTHVLRNREDAKRASSEMSFPCVLKPSLKTPEWEAYVRDKALMVETPEALLDLYARHARWAPAMVVQEWIEGRDTDHYTCDTYLSATGEPLATFVTRKLRQWPPVVGQGCLSVEYRDETVRDLTLKTLSLAGHRGQGYVEVKRDAGTGRHLIIEANVGRPTGRSAAAEKAGVELLMTMYSDLVGDPLPTSRVQRFRGTKWIHARRDAQACMHALLHGRTTIPEILRSWRGPMSPALFSLRDPVPFLADLGSALGASVSAPRAAWRRVTGRGSSEEDPATVPSPSVSSAHTTMFDVEGVFRVRTEGAGPADLSAVARVVGPPTHEPVTEAPDVTVRFVDELREGPVRILDGGRTAFGPDGVYFLDPPGGRPVACVSQDGDWGRASIECRRGARIVPFLSEAFDLCALARGWIPLHGSAWQERDGGVVLVTGWARSGKTGALLAARERGARPVGDDRILLARDGSRVIGVGRPVVVKDWHLAQIPVSAPGVGRARRALAHGVHRIAAGLEPGPDSGKGTLGRIVRKGLSHLRDRVSVEVDPAALGATRVSATPRALVLLETHRERSIEVEPVDGRHVADRVGAQVAAELLPAMRAQLSFQYARPGDGWQTVHQAPETAVALLREATAEMPTYAVRHPYPCSAAGLERAISNAGRPVRADRAAAHERVPAPTPHARLAQ